MLYLVLVLLLTLLALTAVLWGGTRLIQTALYEQPQADLLWRAPAAAGALTLYLGIWALCNYAAAEPGQTDLPFDTFFNFTSEKVSDRPISEFTAVRSDGKTKYEFISHAGSPRVEYRSVPDYKVWMVDREPDVQALIVKEGDQEVTFKNDAAHKRYVEEGGKRYLDQQAFGPIRTPRGGGSFVRLLLNVLLLAVCFAVLWLLLGFHWPHALGVALALWVALICVAPTILRAGAEAKAPPARVKGIIRR